MENLKWQEVNREAGKTVLPPDAPGLYRLVLMKKSEKIEFNNVFVCGKTEAELYCENFELRNDLILSIGKTKKLRSRLGQHFGNNEKSNRLKKRCQQFFDLQDVSLDNLAKQGKLNDPFEIYNTYMKRKPNMKNSQSKTSLQSALTVRELEAVQVFEICFPYTENQLKKRYKILVKKYHPDLNQGSKKAEEMFKKISECYRILLKKISKNK